jgi:thymidylate synthase ThyX
MIDAKIIADSKNQWGNRLITFLITMPRIILAEFNTHRMLSRNSASSRAIPFKTTSKRVEDVPFVPIAWMKDHSGMQGTEFFNDTETLPLDGNPLAIDYLKTEWLKAMHFMQVQAKLLNNAGLSKQICNRLLEPFMWHQVIVTGTEWENFFALRDHPDAEMHIRKLAHIMLQKANESNPKLLEPGDWHIPFIEQIDILELERYAYMHPEMKYSGDTKKDAQLLAAKISAGICAGISYGRVKDKTDIEDMLDLCNVLTQRPYSGKRGTKDRFSPIHASPTEHQARCMTLYEYDNILLGFGWCGNFRGFIQLRKLLANENAKDSRLLKK